MTKAKPFIKWAGGKRQLIEQIEDTLPSDFDKWRDITYIEPFVGGGAVLFHLLQTHHNIKHAVINDINSDLTTSYKTVRNHPMELIDVLASIQEDFYKLHDEDRKKEYYLTMRDKFNAKPSDSIYNTALLLFLNHTCFNGLYRVNKSGKFNVPFGRYAHPLICDSGTILADSKILQKVEILTGDFERTIEAINGKSFFYFDPPYRPLNETSSFNSYTKEAFNDTEQIRLKKFCDKLNNMNVDFMLSNSDCSAANIEDRFFDNLFVDYEINHVKASRCINANGAKRGKLTELLVCNYANRRKHCTHNNIDLQLKLAL